MIYAFILTAYVILGLSLGGIIVILGRGLLAQLSEGKVSLYHKLSLPQVFSWIKKKKITFPKKVNISVIHKAQQRKSQLKKDYWDKLLK